MLALLTLGATGYASSSADAHYPRLGSDASAAKQEDTPDRVTASVNLPDWLRWAPGIAADGIFGRVTRLSIGHRNKISRLTPEEKASLDVLYSLQALEIEGFLLDRDDIERLANYPDLYHLTLQGCTFAPGAFEPIGHLNRLQYLYLSGSSVTDDDLLALAGLVNLGTLDLSHTEITDQGLSHLERLPSLRRLELSGSRVTDAGVEKLRAAIPGLQLLDD